MVQLRHRKPDRTRRRRNGWSVSRVILIGALAALPACDRHAGRYFPLGEGVTRIYRQTVIIRNKGNAGAYSKNAYVTTSTTLPEQKIGDTEVAPQLYADGTILYYRRTAEGVALVASRRRGEPAPAPLAPRFVIKYPVELGATWHTDGRTEVLMRTFLSGIGAVTKPVYVEMPLVFKVEGTDDTVRVDAGTFRHCLRLHGSGKGSMLWGGENGTIGVSVDTVQWYAPKVGLVKEVRTESTGVDGPLGGELTEELAMVKRPGWFQ